MWKDIKSSRNLRRHSFLKVLNFLSETVLKKFSAIEIKGQIIYKILRSEIYVVFTSSSIFIQILQKKRIH